MQVGHFKPEAGDTEHESGEGCLIGQLGAESSRARARGDLAVVEFRAQCRARLARESAASVPGSEVCVITP